MRDFVLSKEASEWENKNINNRKELPTKRFQGDKNIEQRKILSILNLT